MSTTSSRSALASLALGLAAALLAAPAQAVIYSGHWDPLYGPPLPALGWDASALIALSDACLAQGDGIHEIVGACAGVGIDSAEVSFYNAADPSRTLLESFALTDVANLTVTSVSTLGGKLSGIGTGFFAGFVPSATGAAASIDGAGLYSFNLVLLGGGAAQLYYASPPDAPPGCTSDRANSTICGKSLNPAMGVFAPVPEPATIVSMAAGLGVIGLLARRRRERA